MTELPVTALVLGNLELDGEFSGLATYILATIEAAGGGAILPATAEAIADDILARIQGGLSLTSDDIDTIIDANEAGASLAGGDSFGDVTEILQIASGYKVFTLPNATVVQLINDFNDAGLAVAVPAGFSDPADADRLFTKFYDSFYVSARKGQLKKAQTAVDAQGNPDPIVVCYADDGSLIQ